MMINKNAMKIKNLKNSTSVYLSLVNWEGYTLLATPHFCLGMPSCLHLVGLVQSWFLVILCGWVEGMESPLCQWLGSLCDWVGVFSIKVDDDRSSKYLNGGVHTHFIPPVVLLLWLSSMSSCGGHSVCHPMTSMGWDVYPSAKCTWSCRHPHPLHITWSLHPSSVDAPVDIHRRSHSFPLIHPREVFLAWCWVDIRPPSSHGAVLLSLPLRVGLTGVGLVHLSHTWWTPIHKGTPASDMTRRSQLWCRMHDCLHWSVTL